MGDLPQSDNPDYLLTESQKQHFLTHGYLKLSSCFTPSQAASFTSNIWTRLGMSPEDKSTWGNTERLNMPWHCHVPVETFAPKAWSAMCQLLGGEERIQQGIFRSWSDGFIVNFGREEFEGIGREEMDGRDLRELRGWHNDGDFFVHFCRFGFLVGKNDSLLLNCFVILLPSSGSGIWKNVGALAKMESANFLQWTAQNKHCS